VKVCSISPCCASRFRHVTCSLGTHLKRRPVFTAVRPSAHRYLTFDVDANAAANKPPQQLAQRLCAQVSSLVRLLPDGHDPNSFFVQGGDARHSLSSGGYSAMKFCVTISRPPTTHIVRGASSSRPRTRNRLGQSLPGPRICPPHSDTTLRTLRSQPVALCSWWESVHHTSDMWKVI